MRKTDMTRLRGSGRVSVVLNEPQRENRGMGLAGCRYRRTCSGHNPRTGLGTLHLEGSALGAEERFSSYTKRAAKW